MAYFRNLETGAIKEADPQSADGAKLKSERTKDGRFPLWEQTSNADADPKTHAASYEVENRSKWKADIHDVTTDGVLQSGPSAVGGVSDVQAELKDPAGASSSSSAKS